MNLLELESQKEINEYWTKFSSKLKTENSANFEVGEEYGTDRKRGTRTYVGNLSIDSGRYHVFIVNNNQDSELTIETISEGNMIVSSHLATDIESSGKKLHGRDMIKIKSTRSDFYSNQIPKSHPLASRLLKILKE